MSRRTTTRRRKPRRRLVTRREAFGDLGLVPPVVTRGISTVKLAAKQRTAGVVTMANRRVLRVPVWAWVGGATAVGIGVAYWQRERISQEITEATESVSRVVTEAVDEATVAAETAAKAVASGIAAVTGPAIEAARRALFRTALSLDSKTRAAANYIDIIERVARDEKVPASIIVALGARESHWGALPTSLYKQQCGDWVARRGHWTDRAKHPRVRLVNSAGEAPGFTIPKPAAGQAQWPVAIPDDGLGWGRGLMQIDYEGALAAKIDWRDPYLNVREGARVYKAKLKYLQNKGMPAAHATIAALAAYNAGEGTVWAAYQKGGMARVDTFTTGGDYSSWVSKLMAALEPKEADVIALAEKNAGGGVAA